MTVVLPITGSPNWDVPLDSALLDLQSQAQAAQTTANSGITSLSTKVTKDALVYNVKDHGAVGNGATDDTTAIQTTINLASASGGIVFFPVGTYNLSASLTLANNIILAGSGHTTTILKQNSTSSDGFVLADAVGIRIENIRLTGPGSGTGRGVHFTTSISTSTSFISMQDVVVTAFGGDGINISLPVSSQFNKVITTNCGGYGFNLFGTSVPTSYGNTLDSCYSFGCTTGGFRLFNVAYTTLNSCLSLSTLTGYTVDTCKGVVLNGCGAQSCTTGIKVNAGTGNSIISHLNYDNKGIGIQVTSNAVTIGIFQAVEITPHAGATHFIQVDAGSFATIIGMNFVTANLFTGTTQILDDGTTGAATINGTALINNNLKINTVGNGLFVKEGTNAKMGVATLVAGTVVVSTTAVTANSRIMLTGQNTSGTPGSLGVSARTAGTSFTVLSTSGTDTRQVAWFIIEPA
jgi:hypothetical protein